MAVLTVNPKRLQWSLEYRQKHDKETRDDYEIRESVCRSRRPRQYWF